MRKRHEWLSTPLKKKRVKRATRVRCGLQDAIDRIFPTLPAFFGRPKSKNNEIYRKWGLKLRTNEEMRLDYIERARHVVEDKLHLRLPKVDALAA